MQIFNLIWLVLPIGLYFLIKRYHLHTGELWLLLYANILVLSTFFDGWIMQITHLIIVTASSMHVLSVCKEINGSLSQKKYRLLTRIFLHFQQQFSILCYGIAAWLFLRQYTSKSAQFGVGIQYKSGKIFEGVNKSLHGWNCTQLEFVVIPFFWILINLISYVVSHQIITVQSDKDNMYKQYVLKYNVLPNIVCSIITFAFNLYSYNNSQNLFQCCQHWQSFYSILMKVSLYVGFSGSILYFFYVKKGVFLLEEDKDSSNEADNDA